MSTEDILMSYARATGLALGVLDGILESSTRATTVSISREAMVSHLADIATRCEVAIARIETMIAKGIILCSFCNNPSSASCSKCGVQLCGAHSYGHATGIYCYACAPKTR